MVDTECVRSKTANLFLASQTAVRPEDLLPSGAAHHGSQQYQDSTHHTHTLGAVNQRQCIGHDQYSYPKTGRFVLAWVTIS